MVGGAKVAEKRGPGRPKRAEGPAFPREEVDRLLVHGEFDTLEDGETIVTYPTYRQLADRFDVTLSSIADFARKRNCRIRRKDQQLRVGKRAREQLTERHAELLAVSLEQILDGVSRYILKFAENVADGNVACNNPVEFEKMVRLFAFISGGPDSRKEVNTTLSLDALQARYSETFRVGRASPEVRGVLDATVTTDSLSDQSTIPDEVPPDEGRETACSVSAHASDAACSVSSCAPQSTSTDDAHTTHVETPAESDDPEVS